jgi:predicted ATP-dependent serine protease
VSLPGFESGFAALNLSYDALFRRGSVLLVGGDPGIGKSTLLIKAPAVIAPYWSGHCGWTGHVFECVNAGR